MNKSVQLGLPYHGMTCFYNSFLNFFLNAFSLVHDIIGAELVNWWAWSIQMIIRNAILIIIIIVLIQLPDNY